MSVYHHFSPEEYSLIDQILDWKAHVEEEYALKKTAFFNPREVYILQSVIGKSDEVKIFESPQLKELERQRYILAPSFYEIQNEDFDVSLLEVQYPHKFCTLTHAQVLGALVNLGVKRRTLGDILFDEKEIQIVVAKEMSRFIQANLTAIHRAKVSVSEIDFSMRIERKESWQEEQITVASRRLDAIVCAMTKLSRQKAQELIVKEGVQVNYRVCTKVAQLLQENDFLSIRRHGRMKIKGFLGKTKKDRERVVYDKLC